MADKRKRAAAAVQLVNAVGSFSLCAASVAAACTCLALFFMQRAHLQELRAELWEVKHRAAASYGENAAHTTRSAVAVPDMCRCGRGVLGQEVSRMRRDVSAKGKRRQRQLGQRRRTFLHLVPVSSHSYDEDDKTLVKWTVGQSQGEGLQVSGERITVTRGGLYFIYSQVLYEDSTFVMGHVIKKHLQNSETVLMKCVKRMPRNVSEALNTCYTAGAQNLESGSILELSIPRKNAGVGLLPHATFLGIYKI